MKFIGGLGVIHDLFDVFLIDLNGVVYEGDNLYQDTLACLVALKKAGKTILFLSNMPRDRTVASQKLRTLGIDVEGCHILTSGDVVREQLKNPSDEFFTKHGSRFYHFGGDTNQDILKGLDVEPVTTLDEADYVLLSKYVDCKDYHSKYEAEVTAFLRSCLVRKLPMVCTNPDIYVIHNGLMRYTAGFFARLYAEMGGKVYYYGKPYANIYQAAFATFGSDKKYLMIGDNLETDIRGAQEAKIDSVLVMTGNMAELLKGSLKNGSIDPEYVANYIQDNQKPIPTYIAPSFLWEEK